MQVLSGKSRYSLQFFFATVDGKPELKRERLAALLAVFTSELEVNPIICFRISTIIESLVQTSHVELLRAFIALKLEEHLLSHFYDESVALGVYFNVLVNIRGSGSGDASLMFDSPKKSRSPSIELSSFAEKAEPDPRAPAYGEPFEISLVECRGSPTKRPSKDNIFLNINEEEFQEYSKKPTQNSLNFSNGLDKDQERFLHGILNYRVAVLRRVAELAAATGSEEAAQVALSCLIKFVRECRGLLSYKQLVLNLFYKDNSLASLFARAKAARPDRAFTRTLELLIGLLELNREIFPEKVVNEASQKLADFFTGTYIEIIESLKDELSAVG